LSSTRDLPLGGYIIVFGGDFRQTLPLPRRLADRIQVVENTILQHPLWKHVRHISLLDEMRARESTEEFRKWLLNIGNGNPTVLSTGVVALHHHIDIPVDMCARNLVDLEKVVFRRALKTNKQVSEARYKQATHVSETRDGSSFVASHYFIVCPIHVMKGFTHRQRFNLQPRFIKTRIGRTTKKWLATK